MNTHSSTYNLPDELGEQLRCSHCDAYLSCGPVKVQPNGGTVCGRCSPSLNEECIQQVLFEAAMARLTFPCRYKLQGCKKRVLFNNAIEHEIECPYRTFPCPCLPLGSCPENVSTFDIRQHFETAHSSLVVKDEILSIGFEQEMQRNLLVIKDNVVAVVQYSYDSIKRVLHIDVRHLLQDDVEVINYQLQIASGLQSENMINLKKRPCNRFNSHCIDKQDAFALIMDYYLPVLDNPSFVCIKVRLTADVRSPRGYDDQIRHISNNYNGTMRNIIEESDEQTKTVWKLREKYRCSNCFSHIAQPLYYVDYNSRILCNKCNGQS